MATWLRMIVALIGLGLTEVYWFVIYSWVERQFPWECFVPDGCGSRLESWLHVAGISILAMGFFALSLHLWGQLDRRLRGSTSSSIRA